MFKTDEQAWSLSNGEEENQNITAARRPTDARRTTSRPASAGRQSSVMDAAMSQSLLLARRFAPLFWCQFFAALNDNLLKNALAMFVLFKIGGEGGASLVTLATATLMAPYFILSALGGELADKFDKGLVTRRLKLAEIGAAAIAVAGFYASSVEALFFALFLFGALGALFSPAKYGILPDCLRREELPKGNALVEAATFIAILVGTILGGLATEEGRDPAYLALGMIGFAILSYASAWFIPPTARADSELSIDVNIARSTFAFVAELYREPKLWRLGLVTSIFWLLGAVGTSLLPTLVAQTMHGAQIVATAHLAVFAVAIGLGSGLAAYLSHGKIVLLPSVLGAAGAAIAAADLCLMLAFRGPAPAGPLLSLDAYFAQPGAWRALIDLALMSVSGGMIVVPAFAALQAYSNPARRARLLAAVSVLNAAAMVGGGLLVAALQQAGAPIAALFGGVALFAAASALWINKAVVENPLRDLLSIFFRSLYRLEVKGLENFDRAGPNPIVALNHVSFLDAALALSIMPRAPIFAIDRNIAAAWWVKPFLRFAHVVPLDPTKPLGARTLVNAVKSGEPLVIFPEGRLTVTGSLMKVYDGAGLIADKSDALVLPVRIEGPEATIFSRVPKTKEPRRLFPKFKLTVLEPVRLSVDPNLKGRKRRAAAGLALYHVMSDLLFVTTDVDRTIFQATVDAARHHGPSRIALEDPVTGKLSYRKLLTAARALGEKLAALTEPGETVGLMVPNANGACVAILALSSAGRVPAMVNFTAGSANILAGLRGAGAKRIATSRAFIEAARLEKLVAALSEEVEILYLEELRESVTALDKLRALLLHERALAPRTPEHMAAVLFTSGSEGAPKGVALSHRNMLTNIAQAAARIDFSREDKVFNVLPIFHCFGLTVGFVLPLVSGVPIYLYPSPLHYRIVPELVYSSNATVLFGTDTFLAGYARTANAYDFRSIRYVVAGAEPVKEGTRAVWSEKFGVRILEGYGVTETAPVLALNTPMHNKFGTVGHLLPGIEPRLEPVDGVEGAGRLFVRGPNVMLGYLRAENPGVLEPPKDGWHDTGDIVAIDAEGYVTIKGRAKRFAKIGGEMISLARIEALAGELWPEALSGAASEADPRKGERIVLATTCEDATRAAFQAFAKSKGASELMIPAEIVIVGALPLLGSGKLDFAAVTKMIRSRARAESEVEG
jgi:acyl-[acyl-carrier-protein]-phospholipid O-acyltransferase / long-chain-fatty-acid--[acyl-carrier-protein] ligase